MQFPLPLRKSSWVLAGLALLTLGAFRLPAEDGPFQRIVKSLVTFYGTSLPEKAYLHLDQAQYASGETIWFKAYLVEADSHLPDTLSKVLYVDLLRGPRLVAQRTLRLRGGLAHGDIALPDTLPAGSYQLRAYTSWMRNAGTAFFFTRQLAIHSEKAPPAHPPAEPKVEVQFFPEGGSLVETLASEVGFKAVDAYGRGVAVTGTVLDAQRQPVASFSSRHLGMGSFRLVPAVGQQYRAVVTLPGGRQAEYPVPASQPTGYSLHVSETAADFVVTLHRHLAAGASAAGPALLLAQVRGKVGFAAQVPVSGAAPVIARLPKAKLRPGLAHITLFDEQGTAQCERLVLVPNAPGVRLALVPDKPAYAPREAVRLRLSATNEAGQPVVGEFSVAVAAGESHDAASPTILSHLLLTSDLAGVVEAPGYYFQEPQTPEIRQALNDLLLTQGWRRFVWKSLLAGQLPSREFALEQGLGVSGRVFTAAQQPAAAHPVAYWQAAPPKEAQTLTTATGDFRFRGLDGLDTTLVMLRATPAKNEPDLHIRLLAPPPGETMLPAWPLAADSPARLAAAVRRSQQHVLEQRAALGSGRSIALSTVRVQGQRALAAADNITRPYSAANAVVLHLPDPVQTAESRSLLQVLQGRVAGVAVSGNQINIRQSASLQDQTTGGYKLIEPLYLIDGAIVPADVFISYPAREIETIDVLNQSAATMFGIQGYGGVIAAYSRKGGATASVGAPDGFAAARRGALSVSVPGYYRAREFYAPRYPAAPASPPDPRYTTLYWAPEVRTDALGQAQLSFFTSDAKGTFQATAEGMSSQGTPMRASASLLVK